MEIHTQWTDTNIVKTQMSFTLARAAAAAKSTMAGRGCPWYQVRVDTPGDGDAGLPELFSLFNFNVMPFSGRRPATQLFSPLRSFLSRPWRAPPGRRLSPRRVAFSLAAKTMPGSLSLPANSFHRTPDFSRVSFALTVSPVGRRPGLAHCHFEIARCSSGKILSPAI